MAETATSPVVFKDQEAQQVTQNMAQNVSAAIGMPVKHEDILPTEELHPLNRQTQQQIAAASEFPTMQKGDDEHEKGNFFSRIFGGIFAKKVGVGPAGEVLEMKQHDVNRRYGGAQKLEE
jgi:hypothetical protein